MHIQQLNQKYQYYLNESQRLNEELQEERVYIDLLESIISEILTAEDIDVLAEGEKRVKRIQDSLETRLRASGNIVPDVTDTSPGAMATRARMFGIDLLRKARDTAISKLRRRISKGLESSLPTGKQPDVAQDVRDEQLAKHTYAVQHGLKNRLDPKSITSGSNAPKTAAKALEGGASPRDVAALLQRTTGTDMPRLPQFPAGKELPKGAPERIVRQVRKR